MAIADKYPRLKRLAPLFLVAGLGASYLVSSHHAATDHKITYQFSAEPTDVTLLEASWSSANPKDPDSVAGARYSFAEGKAPKAVNAKVKLRDGEYFVELTVSGKGPPRSVKRRVMLDDHDTTVMVP